MMAPETRYRLLAIALATIPALGSCDRLLVNSESVSLRLVLAPITAVSETSSDPAEAFLKIEDARVRILGSENPFDRDVPFHFDEGAVRLDPIELELSSSARLRIVVVLSGLGSPLFVADGPVELNPASGFTETLTARSIPGAVEIGAVGAFDALGETLQLSASATLATGEVDPAIPKIWTSLDPDIATVTSGGLMTSVAEGDARVQVESRVAVDGLGIDWSTSDIVTVAIQATVDAVVVDPLFTETMIGGVTELNGTARDRNGSVLARVISWSSSDEDVVRVTPAGNATAEGLGSATITADVEGVSAGADFMVVPHTVAQIHALANGATIAAEGVISSQLPWDPRTYTLQDATAGVTVFDLQPGAWEEGDRVRVSGTRSMLRGQVQISSVTDRTLLERVSPPEPRLVTGGDVNQGRFPSELVELTATVEAVEVVGLVDQRVTLKDEVGTELRVFVDARTGIEPSTWPSAGSPVLLRGLMWTDDQDDPAHEIRPRSVSDVIPIVRPEDHIFRTPGNTALVSPNLSPPSYAHWVSSGHLLSGTPSLDAVPGTFGTANGGSVTVQGSGAFEYWPPVGFDGIDTFAYSVTGGDEGLVTVEIDEMVWYAGPGGSGAGTGHSGDPFSNPTSFSSSSGPGDLLFVDHNVPDPDVRVILKDDQMLFGEGEGLTVPGFGNIVPAGSPPTLTSTFAAAVVLANRNTVAGLLIDRPSSSGIVGDQISDVTIHSVQVTFPGFAGLRLTQVGGAVQLSNTGWFCSPSLNTDILNTVGSVDVTIANSGFGNQFDIPACPSGSSGLQLRVDGSAQATLDVRTSDFSRTGTGLSAVATGQGSLEATVQSNTFRFNSSLGLNFSNGQDAQLDYDVSSTLR